MGLKKVIADVVIEGIKAFVTSAASSAGTNVGSKVAPPKEPKDDEK